MTDTVIHPWIESAFGKNWLEGSISALIFGFDVVIRYTSPRIEVTATDFIARFAEKAAEIYTNDSSHTLEWRLARGYTLSPDPYKSLAREVAMTLLMPHAAIVEEMERSCQF